MYSFSTIEASSASDRGYHVAVIVKLHPLFAARQVEPRKSGVARKKQTSVYFEIYGTILVF